jgi:transcriptional regulator with XRE-family HTH domain
MTNDPILNLRQLVNDKESAPNKFTRAVGELIKQAREETSLTQIQLGEMVFRSQTAISDIETGKSEINWGMLLLLSSALKKPIAFFCPRWIEIREGPESLTANEMELLALFRQVGNAELKKVVFEQIRAITKADIAGKKTKKKELPPSGARRIRR